MVARTYASAEQYRYGFNGQEHEDDIAGGDYDFGARIYDPRIARWLSIDPTKLQNVGWTPYQFGKDCPIAYIDPDGAKEYVFITDINATTGKVKIMKLPAKAVLMTDGIEHKVYEDSENYHYENYYYDFITNFIVVHHADGSVTMTTKVTIIKTEVPKGFEFVGPLDPFGDDYGDLMLDKSIAGMRGDSPCEWCGDNSKSKQGGGVVFSGSNDAASIPEMYRDAISENITVVEGDILDLLGGNSSSSPTTMMETAKTIADGLDKAVSAALELRKQIEAAKAQATQTQSGSTNNSTTKSSNQQTNKSSAPTKVLEEYDVIMPAGDTIKHTK